VGATLTRAAASPWPLHAVGGKGGGLTLFPPLPQSLHQPAPDEQQGLLLLQGHHHGGGRLHQASQLLAPGPAPLAPPAEWGSPPRARQLLPKHLPCPGPRGPGPSMGPQRGAGGCREGAGGRTPVPGVSVPLAQRLGCGSPSARGPFSGRGAQGLEGTAALGTRGSPGARGPGWAFGLLTCSWLGADVMKCSIKLFFLMWCPVTRGGKPGWPWRVTRPSGHTQRLLSGRWKYKYLI